MDEPINQNNTIQKIIPWMRNNLLEITFLLIFLGFLLKFSSVLSGQLLVHESPYQFVAGDMFWLTAEGLGIMNTNDIDMRSPLIMKGDDGVYNNYPFILPIIIAELSFFTGFEAYDVLFHLNVFFMLFIITCTYFILRKIDMLLAIAGIPLVLLIFKWPFNYVLTWGGQMSVTNMFLIFFAILAFMFLNIPYMFIVLGILNAAGMFSHARESLMFNIGILFFFIVQVIKKQFDKKLFTYYIISAIITVLVLFNWLPIMHGIFGVYGGGTSLIRFCPANQLSNHAVFFKEFSFLQWPILGGFILALAGIFLSKMQFYKKFGIIVFVSFVFNSYFCVMGNKTTQIRHFFPITLAVFLGFFIWTIMSQIPISKTFRKAIVLFMSIMLLIIFVFSFFPQPVAEYAVSNPLTHDAFNWINNNLADDEIVLYGYGDNHYQWSLFFLPMKLHDLVDQADFILKVQQKTISSEFKVRRGSLGYYFKRTSFFNMELKGLDFFENKTICDYDYYYFNKASQYSPVDQYHYQLKSILINELNFTEVYTNQLVTILKNPKKGGACFDSRKFIFSD